MNSLFNSSARVFLAFGLVALLVQSAYAHTYLSTVVLGGTQLAEGDCVRHHPATAYDSPITLVSSTNMTCGFNPEASQPANRKCPIAAGSSMGIVWHHNNNDASDDIISPTHVGPVMFYLAKSDNGAGNVWFKIYQDGWDATTGKWATDRLIANKGLVTFTIPSDISSGNYLLRGEILALHNGYAIDGVQPYVGCVELTITGAGCANPAGVAFPGAYVDTDPGLYFNVYQSFSSYPIPGPAVYVSGSSSCSSGGRTAPATAAPTSAPVGTAAPAPVTAAPVTAAPVTAAPVTAAPVTAAPVTAAPITPVSGSGIAIQMNSGTNTWWLGLTVSGASETTTKVEFHDSGAVSSWTALSDMGYAWTWGQSIQLTLPISVRLTSSSQKQVVITNIFTSWTNFAAINTGVNYGSTSAPTSAPVTAAPVTAAPVTAAPVTAAPTIAPTAPAAPTSPVVVSVYPSANQWWFAITVNTAATVAKVELMDSGSVTAYTAMTYNSWGYSFNTAGAPLVAPLAVRVTSASGKTATATINTITPTAVFHASSGL